MLWTCAYTLRLTSVRQKHIVTFVGGTLYVKDLCGITRVRLRESHAAVSGLMTCCWLRNEPVRRWRVNLAPPAAHKCIHNDTPAALHATSFSSAAWQVCAIETEKLTTKSLWQCIHFSTTSLACKHMCIGGRIRNFKIFSLIIPSMPPNQMAFNASCILPTFLEIWQSFTHQTYGIIKQRLM